MGRPGDSHCLLQEDDETSSKHLGATIEASLTYSRRHVVKRNSTL